MSVSWKPTIMYPKWLHNYLKADPKWSKATFIRQKWSQNNPKVTPKSTQSDLKSRSYVKIAAKNFPKWIQSGPKWSQSDSNSASYAKTDPTQSDPKVAPSSHQSR